MLRLDQRQKTELEAQLLEIIRHDLAPAEVESVSVTLDRDLDGDEVFRIAIVYDAPDDKLSGQRLASLGRRLQGNLNSVSPEAFPVFSYKTRRDVNPEAA